MTAETVKHHPRDVAWLSEVNAVHQVYAKGETNITEFRAHLLQLRIKHNRVVK